MRVDFIFFIHELLHVDKSLSFITCSAHYSDIYRHLLKRDADGELRTYIRYLFVKQDARFSISTFLEHIYND